MKRPKLRLSTSLVQDNIPAQISECPRVFIGSIHAAFNVDKLREIGITHILNASGLPATFPRAFNYLTIELRDKNHANILGCIPAANIFIEAGLDQGGSVLVHCAGGRSRSAAFITAFLMSTQGLSLDRALRAVKAARAVVNVNLGFQLQLQAYAAAQCDVHLAHQLILHKRLERFTERMSRVPRFQTLYAPGAAQGKDEAASPPSLHEEAREAALKTLDYHPPSIDRNHVRLRLSRPGSSSIQVIPPLRSLERVICCRYCGTHLFTYGNVVRRDLDASALDVQAWAQTVMINRSRGMEVEADSAQASSSCLPVLSPPTSARLPSPTSSPVLSGYKLIKSQSQPRLFDCSMDAPPRATAIDPSFGPSGMRMSKSASRLHYPFDMDDLDTPDAPAEEALPPRGHHRPGRRRRGSSDNMGSPRDRDFPGSPAFSLTDAPVLSPSSLPLLACSSPPSELGRPSLDDQASLPPIQQDGWRAASLALDPTAGLATSPLSDAGFFTPPSSSRSPPSSSAWPLESSPSSFRHQRSYSMEKRMWLDRLGALEAISHQEGAAPTGEAKAAADHVSERVAKVAADDEAAQRALYSQTITSRFFESPPPTFDDGGKADKDSMQVESPTNFASQPGGASSPPSPEKAFYLEHMPWMGDVTRDLHGPLHCPKCDVEVGRYAWETTVDHRLQRPLFAVLRKQVAALPLPSEKASRESTPRTTPTSTPGATAASTVPLFSAPSSPPTLLDPGAAPAAAAAADGQAGEAAGATSWPQPRSVGTGGGAASDSKRPPLHSAGGASIGGVVAAGAMGGVGQYTTTTTGAFRF